MLTSMDKINLGVIATLDISAFVANLMLIAAIYLRTPKILRTYSVFLLNNAIIDLFSAIASALGTVRIVQDHEGSSMIYVFLGPCSLIDEHICRLSHALHIELVSQSTIILLLSFAFRLYVIDDRFATRPTPSRLQIWLLCLCVYLPMALHTGGYFLCQKPSNPETLKRLHLEGYTTSTFALFDSILAVFLNASIVILSPVVMIIIFYVRRRLIARIEQSGSIEKSHHVFIARALTYQMLLPCGLAVGASLWLCDIAQIWSSEYAERIMAITCSMLPLASPLINFTLLPPYRAIFPFYRTRIASNGATMDLTSTAITVQP